MAAIRGKKRNWFHFDNKNRLIFTYLLRIIVKEVMEMRIETSSIVTATEANQNFSRVTRIAEQNGTAVIFKNNRPKYLLVDVDKSPVIEMSDDEKIDFVAARILKKYKPAFLELAK